jgi:O-antigen ligase
MLIVILVPQIVYLKVIPLKGDLFYGWNGQTVSYDFFSYYKGKILILLTCLAVITLGIKMYREGKESLISSYYYIPMGIFSLFIIISTVLSRNKAVALNGYVDRHEGMIVLLSYLLLLFIVINLVRTEAHVKLILVSLAVLLIVNCIIGVFQYLGYDLWNSSLGRHLMLGSNYKLYSDNLNFNIQGSEIYTTFYHYNYVGSFTAMMFPMSGAIFVLIKNKRLKIFSAVLVILSGINLIGSSARSGLIGVSFALIVFLVMINKYIIKHWKFFSVLVVLVISLFIGLNIYSKGAVLNRVNSLISDIVKITQIDNEMSNESENPNLPLKTLSIQGNKAEIVTPTDTLKVSYEREQILFYHENGTVLNINYNSETGKVTILDDKYKDYNITIGKIYENTGLSIKRGQLNLKIAIINNQLQLVDNQGKEISLEQVEKWGFEGKEKLGSARGYIWSRSIPLLKNTLIKGFGPDTFAIHFPQNDFMGKMAAYDGEMWMFVDKPHNLYLQTALNTGGISLLAMLAIFIAYFISSVRLYIKNNYDNFMSITGVALFAAVCGYLGAGMFNDSVVSVAPVFWVILGLGISVNSLVKKRIIKGI